MMRMIFDQYREEEEAELARQKLESTRLANTYDHAYMQIRLLRISVLVSLKPVRNCVYIDY